jgi:hypothetical protein
MRHAAALPAELAGAPFAVADAERNGVSRGRLRARDLNRPFRGVRVPLALLAESTDEQKFTRLCDAFQTKLPERWFFSSVTAARIMGIPVPRRFESMEVHVSSLTPHERPRGKRVRGHSAPGATIVQFNGRPVREPAQLWCELAAVLEVDELIQAGDRLLSDKPFRLTTLTQLEAAVRRHGRRPGARKLREALPQLRENVWSPKETTVRLTMLRAGMPEPENNKPIYDERGRLVAIGDLVLEEFMTVVEYEGERWHADERATIDIDRFNALSALKWTIVRVRKHHSRAEVERLVGRALRANGWNPDGRGEGR